MRLVPGAGLGAAMHRTTKGGDDMAGEFTIANSACETGAEGLVSPPRSAGAGHASSISTRPIGRCSTCGPATRLIGPVGSAEPDRCGAEGAVGPCPNRFSVMPKRTVLRVGPEDPSSVVVLVRHQRALVAVEQRACSRDHLGVVEFHLPLLLPLPPGEGWGEGRASGRTLTPALSRRERGSGGEGGNLKPRRPPGGP